MSKEPRFPQLDRLSEEANPWTKYPGGKYKRPERSIPLDEVYSADGRMPLTRKDGE